MDCEQLEQERRICKFLTKSKQMYEAIEYIINKPERVNLNYNLRNFQICNFNKFPAKSKLTDKNSRKLLPQKNSITLKINLFGI